MRCQANTYPRLPGFNCQATRHVADRRLRLHRLHPPVCLSLLLRLPRLRKRNRTSIQLWALRSHLWHGQHLHGVRMIQRDAEAERGTQRDVVRPEVEVVRTSHEHIAVSR